jgi:subtilisin-like proprotein convertase family protein
VNPINDNPFIGPLHVDDLVSMEAGSTITIPFVVTDKENETRPSDIEVTAVSNNDAVIPDANVVVGGTGTNRSLTLTALNTEGTVTITVTARDDNEPVAGVTTRTLTVDVDPSPTSVFANLTPITIRETNTANPYPSTITINSGELVGRIHTISVVVDGLTHDVPDDVNIMLVAPNNEKVMLMSDAGNANAVNGVRLTFTDGTAVLPDEGVITTGTYRPSNYRGSEGDADAFPAPVPSGTVNTTLGTFVGDSPIGTWSLYVTDDGTNAEPGMIQFGWSLVIVTRPVIDLDEATLSNGTFEQWNEDQTGEIEFTIDDQVTDPENLEIIITSARPEVVHPDNIRLDRSGGDRIVATIRSTANAFSSSPFNLTFTVVRGRGTAGEASSSITVPVNVLPVADLPTIDAVGNVSTPEDSSISVNVNVNDPDSARSALRLVATSDDESIIPNSRISIAGSDNDVTGLPNNPVRITILPATNAVGSAEISLTAFDESGGSSPVELFTVTVTAVNDAPVLAITPPTSIEAGTTQVTPFTITDAEGQSVIMTASSSDTNIVRNQDVVITPSSGTQTARTLSITTQPNVVGTTRITLAYGDGTATNTFTFNLNVRLPRERNFTNDTLITIRDNNSAAPYPSSITVSNFVGNVSKITVTLNGFEHSFPGDVDILLVSPVGDEVLLMSDAGAGSPVTGLNIEFDQDAAAPVPQNSALSSGSFQPANYDAASDTFAAPAPAGPYEESLDAFNGASPNGTWSLYVMDDFQGDAGRITNGWTLSITTEPLVTLATNVLNTTEDREVSTTFTIQEEPFGGEDFTFDFASTNETLIPADDEHIIIAERGGGTYTLTIIPEENRSGTSLVTIFVTNEDGQTVPVQLRVNVEDVNDAPVITGTVEDVILTAGETTTISGEITISDPETARNDLGVTVASSDAAVLPASNVTVSGNNINITTFGSTRNGTARITITVRDPQGLTATTSFLVTVVRPVTPLFTSSGPITVPTSGVGNPYPSVINVSGLQGSVTRVTVTLVGVSHTFPDDLDVLLVSPNSQAVTLMSDAGGPDDISNLRLTFADGSPGLPEATQITSGTYSPSNYEAAQDNYPAPGPGNIPLGNVPLSAFNGSDPNGNWSLYVVDDGTPDGGSITGWMISIQTTAPTISDILDVTTTEDSPISIPFRVEDGNTDGEDITVTVTTDASPVASVAVTGDDNDRTLTIVPLSNASGTDTITVTARDGTFTATEVFTLTVTPVNDAPIISGLADASTPANRPLVRDFNVFDVENDPLTVNATIADPAFGSVAVTGTGFTRTLRFTPTGVQGNVSVSVTASDGSITTTNTILITVVAPLGPTITDIPDVTLLENGTTNIAFEVSVPDVDATNLVVTSSIEGTPIITVELSGTGEDRTATITALPNQIGTNLVTLTMTDGGTNTASTTFAVVVENVDNDAPVLGAIPNQRTQQNTALVLPLVVSDPDTAIGDLTFFSATLGSGVVQDVRFDVTSSNTVVATITPVSGVTGTETIQISVSDGLNVARQSFTLTVDAPNAAPVIGPINDVQTPEDVSVTVLLNVTDAETPVDQLTITGSASNTNLVSAVNVSNSGGVVQATINLVTNAFGQSTITISAADGTNTTTRSFNLTVVEVPECPVLGTIGNQTVPGGATSHTLTLNVSDPDTALADLTFLSATVGTSIVESVTFNVSGNTVTAVINIRAGATGTERMSITVSDNVCVDREIFDLTIGAEGQPATLSVGRTGTNFVLTITGTPGATYVIEGTTDFRSWTDVGAVTIPAGGSIQVNIPLTGRNRNFRVRSGGGVTAQADVYEGFGYPAGTTISTNESGGTGWITPWTPDVEQPTNHIVLARNMEYVDATGKGLKTTPGSVLYTATTNNMASGDVRSFRNFNPRTNGTSWISFIGQRMGPTITNTGTPNNIYPRAANLSFYEGGTERFAIGNGSGAVSNLWSVLPAGSVGNVTNAQRSATPMHQQAFIVIRVDHIEGANDNLYMWVNPPLGVEPDPATASARSEGAFSFSFDRVRPFAGGADTGNNRPYSELALDEIRVGDSFEEVTPFESDLTNPINAIALVNGTNDGDANAGAPPANEGVERVIDGMGQKYLNFLDLNSGFVVTPLGSTVVNGLRFWPANDAPDRDPTSYRLEGSNDGTTFTLISEGPLNLSLNRNPGGATTPVQGGNVEIVRFPNTTPYNSYRVTFPTLRNATAANSMQIAEVDFIGSF